MIRVGRSCDKLRASEPWQHRSLWAFLKLLYLAAADDPVDLGPSELGSTCIHAEGGCEVADRNVLIRRPLSSRKADTAWYSKRCSSWTALPPRWGFAFAPPSASASPGQATE